MGLGHPEGARSLGGWGSLCSLSTYSAAVLMKQPDVVVLPENRPLPLSSEDSHLLLALNCVQPACRPDVGEIHVEPASLTDRPCGGQGLTSAGQPQPVRPGLLSACVIPHVSQTSGARALVLVIERCLVYHLG